MTFPDGDYEALAKWTTAALDGIPDPATEDGWAYWRQHGWDDREMATRRFRPGSSYRANAEFISAHWHPLGDHEYRCDRFDASHRLCAAHEERPPVCRDYPWYGSEPAERGPDGMIPRCSYLADLPPSLRPEGSRPLIPLTPLNGAC